VEQTHRRVARHADGWMTSLSDPAEVGWRRRDVQDKAREAGRDPETLHTALYHNINVNEDRQAALEESKRFLDAYYMVDMAAARVASWTAAGSPRECIEHLRVYRDLGFHSVGLRCTSWNQMGQLRRVIDEVLPYV
jgi:alkanesulfonate monooxygenase SsuD/methylene tetrahydromethanopterin reductase-like flavin-dependent oxidoreductase (luciferase family)